MLRSKKKRQLKKIMKNCNDMDLFFIQLLGKKHKYYARKEQDKRIS